MRDDGDIIYATREDREPAPNDVDGVEIPPSSHNEVRVAIQHLKNNIATGPDGLPAELFKAGGGELVRSMHQFIYRIWVEASMTSDLSCPELGRPHDMGQLARYKPSLYCIYGSQECIV